MSTGKLNKKGYLIAFEGIDGTGKTEAVDIIGRRLKESGYDVVSVREPGGTEVGEKLRKFLKETKMLPKAELLLYLASRAQLIGEVIKPALQQGKIVLCDRFIDSTIVYQACVKGLPKDTIEKFNEFVIESCEPDLVFVLDMEDCRDAVQRVIKREVSKIERLIWSMEYIKTLEIAQKAYRDLIAQNTSRPIVGINIKTHCNNCDPLNEITKIMADKLGIKISL